MSAAAARNQMEGRIKLGSVKTADSLASLLLITGQDGAGKLQIISCPLTCSLVQYIIEVVWMILSSVSSYLIISLHLLRPTEVLPNIALRADGWTH